MGLAAVPLALRALVSRGSSGPSPVNTSAFQANSVMSKAERVGARKPLFFKWPKQTSRQCSCGNAAGFSASPRRACNTQLNHVSKTHRQRRVETHEIQTELDIRTNSTSLRRHGMRMVPRLSVNAPWGTTRRYHPPTMFRKLIVNPHTRKVSTTTQAAEQLNLNENHGKRAVFPQSSLFDDHTLAFFQEAALQSPDAGHSRVYQHKTMAPSAVRDTHAYGWPGKRWMRCHAR